MGTCCKCPGVHGIEVLHEQVWPDLTVFDAEHAPADCAAVDPALMGGCG